MRYLVTGGQMKAVDRYTIRTVGIPSLVLMERAAAAVAEAVEEEAMKLEGKGIRTESGREMEFHRDSRSRKE